MSHTVRSRIATAVPAAVLALALGVSLPTPAAAHRAEAPPSSTGSTPIGTWDATVTLPDSGHQATFAFAAGGVACMSFGGPGEFGGSGLGTWWRTGTNRFSFRILHDVHDPSGTVVGWVGVNQQALQQADTFTGSGVSQLFAADGTQTGTTTAQVSATRRSTTHADSAHSPAGATHPASTPQCGEGT
ncbi:hypothetical protein ACFZBU_20005 [Embleya sp. NPDC008237]|uniref:hypothetical protein n=1 Tax=Embleya sp. NPDC008237 TaxID=3363978 RepID=UPI0036EA1E4D